MVVIRNLVISALRCGTTSDFFKALGKMELTNKRSTSPVKVGNTWGIH